MWWILEDGSRAGDAEQAEAYQWMRSLEDPFIETHRKARDEFYQLWATRPGERPSSPGRLIKTFEQNADGLYGLVKHVFKKETGQHLSQDAMWRLFYIAPEWPLYLAGWAHEIFQRVLQPSNYGPKGKPGTLDLWCAVYLPICDVLVTNDNGQHRALRLLNVLSRRRAGRPKTRVLKYETFRRRLI
jgi:hypothetical protein